MTADKESSFKQSVDDERQHDEPIDKAVPTPHALHKVKGARDTAYPLCPFGQLGKWKVGNPHRRSWGFRAKYGEWMPKCPPKLGNLSKWSWLTGLREPQTPRTKMGITTKPLKGSPGWLQKRALPTRTPSWHSNSPRDRGTSKTRSTPSKNNVGWLAWTWNPKAVPRHPTTRVGPTFGSTWRSWFASSRKSSTRCESSSRLGVEDPRSVMSLQK